MTINEAELITDGPDLRPIVNEKHYNDTMYDLCVEDYKPYSEFDSQFRQYLNVLINPFTIRITLEKSGVLYVSAEQGFTFDYASIPTAVRSLLPSNSKGMVIAAFVHDVFFSEPERPLTLETANDLFYQLMRRFGVSWWRAKLCLWGVGTATARRRWESNLAKYGVYKSFCFVHWRDK